MTVRRLRSRRLAVGLTLDGLAVVLLVIAAAMGGFEVKVALLLAVPSVMLALVGAVMTGMVITSTQPEGWRLAIAVLTVVVLTAAVLPVGAVVLGLTPP